MMTVTDSYRSLILQVNGGESVRDRKSKAAKKAFTKAQKAFSGEAKRLKLKTPEDVAAMVKKIRSERNN